MFKESVARFIAEACTLDPAVSCTTTDLHDAYRAWCLREGEGVLKRSRFIEAMKGAMPVAYGPQQGGDGKYRRGFTGIRPATSARVGQNSVLK